MTNTIEQRQLKQLYTTLWQEAATSFAKGVVRIDPYLLNLQNDKRRGLTIIARLNKDVTDRFSRFLEGLKSLEPAQYYYDPEQFHITILTLISAREDFYMVPEKIRQYREVFNDILPNAEEFQVAFKGLTASNSAVLIQGFPQSPRLNQLRDRLRNALRKHDLGDELDTRYTITTAHSTIMRFQTQPQNLQRLLAVLTQYREYDFSHTNIQTLQWVKNDWYMSPNNVEALEEYQLSSL